MALELMDEHEKGEQVRAWLRQNGSAIIGGIAIGLGLILGWQWLQRTRIEHRVTAATQYEALQQAVRDSDADAVAALAAALAKESGDTPYAPLAALQLASVKLEAGDTDAALKALQQARELTQEPALRSLLDLRRARLALAASRAEEALAIIQALPENHYAGLAAEIRGDALVALDRDAEAIEAYRDALTQLETGAPNRFVVEMKLTDLGGESAQPEA